MSRKLAAPPDLSCIRRRKGISLHEIAGATKIGVNYLEAIEQGEFSQLPGGIYSTSYIRQYAQAIDYDESELLEYYYSVTGLSPEPVAGPTAPQASTWVRGFLSALAKRVPSQ